MPKRFPLTTAALHSQEEGCFPRKLDDNGDGGACSSKNTPAQYPLEMGQNGKKTCLGIDAGQSSSSRTSKYKMKIKYNQMDPMEPNTSKRKREMTPEKKTIVAETPRKRIQIKSNFNIPPVKTTKDPLEGRAIQINEKFGILDNAFRVVEVVRPTVELPDEDTSDSEYLLF
ncbi:uncharacterized protein LOC130668992 [Microplitis mediator]|uniref:uncharacterized protein LOC130668992 n=1 Tax=Microplitis mediator TaxID=375433 RepID=UPI002555884E|nr:uncharacterized protein LOC130668992 [Microplitis mediator]